MTDVATVKLRRKVESRDTFIGELIAAVSQDAERIMGRQGRMTIGSYVDTLRLRPWRKVVRVPGAPITTLTTVKVSDTDDFTTASELTRNQDFYARLQTGAVELLSSVAYDRHVQVAYDGGFVTDLADLKARFPRIVDAVTNEVVQRFNKSPHPEGDIKLAEGATQIVKPVGRLSDFETTLREYSLRKVVR